MKKSSELIVMLTHNDRTVRNAFKIFKDCRDTKARYWGMKEEGLSRKEMKEIYAYMKDCGKNTVLEVVAYAEKECMAGAKLAVECECNILMGTVFFDSVNEFCANHKLKYMPFVGKVSQRPSILEGSMEEMVIEAKGYLEKGAYGIDLLGYRYTQDAKKLNKNLLERIKAPICIAGSINSYERLDEIMEIAPWAFTIGGAFFERKFGEGFAEQINNVCDYLERNYV